MDEQLLMNATIYFLTFVKLFCAYLQSPCDRRVHDDPTHCATFDLTPLVDTPIQTCHPTPQDDT